MAEDEVDTHVADVVNKGTTDAKVLWRLPSRS